METITMTDVSGQRVCLKVLDLIEQLAKERFLIWGMTLENIVDLQCQYQLRNGKMPMTTESIEEAFGPPCRERLEKIKTFLADMP